MHGFLKETMQVKREELKIDMVHQAQVNNEETHNGVCSQQGEIVTIPHLSLKVSRLVVCDGSLWGLE